MDKAHNAIKSLIVSWNELRTAFPDVVDFSTLGYDDVEATDFDVMFSNWEKTLEHFASDSSYSHNPEIQVIDKRLESILTEIKKTIDANRPNGFPSLLSNASFYQWMSEAIALMASGANVGMNLHKALLQASKSKIGKDLTSINDAAAAAKKFSKSNLPSKAQKIETAISNATKDLEGFNAIKNDADVVQKLLKDYRESLPNTKTEVDGIVEGIRGINKTSVETLNLITGQKQKLEEEIAKSTESVKQANEKVSKALEDINRQGLAGSFAEQADKVRAERWWWLGAFTLSIVGLIMIAGSTGVGSLLHDLIAIFAKSQAATNTAAAATTAQQTAAQISAQALAAANIDWWKAPLHELPFAAPLIWFGWISARQIGVLSKIQQDYSYKASTAVAFEGYKKEVAAVQDEALTKKLLEIAILNFGENPIRIYDGKGNHGMPVEALLAKIFDEKTIDDWLPQFQKICEAIGKCTGRPAA